MKLRMACLWKKFSERNILIKIMKIFSFFAANIKYGGGIVSHLPLCLSSIRRSHIILMAGENNLLLVSFILNLSNRIWSTLPKPLPFNRITVLMYFLGVSVPQCLQWNPKLNICRPFWPCSLTPCIIDYVKTAEEYSKTLIIINASQHIHLFAEVRVQSFCMDLSQY